MVVPINNKKLWKKTQKMNKERSKKIDDSKMKL